MKQLIFAPLVRCSMEKTAKKKDAIEFQWEVITESIESLGGTIPETIKYKYAGTEKATPESERLLLDRLLKDSSKGIFNAVIVSDLSRWARDNQRSHEALSILKKNGIRFFCRTTEYDLQRDPEAKAKISSAVESYELQTQLNFIKSIKTRIKHAKQGYPSTGKLPAGRRLKKDDRGNPIKKGGFYQYEVIPEYQRKVKRAYTLLMKGESIHSVAKKFGKDHTNLRKTLYYRSGTEHKVRFRYPKWGIDSGDIIIKVPPLLKPNEINNIRDRLDASMTIYKKNVKVKKTYLLKGMVFCDNCGQGFYGSTQRKKYRYYRHNDRNKCGAINVVKAFDLEWSVKEKLFDMLGDRPKMEEAISKTIPDMERRRELALTVKDLEKESRKLLKAIDGLLDAEEKSGYNERRAKRLQEHEERIKLIEAEITNINSELADIPTPHEIKQQAKAIRKRIEHLLSVYHFMEMKDKDWQRLFREMFLGKDSASKRFGIYVSKVSEDYTEIQQSGYIRHIMDEDYIEIDGHGFERHIPAGSIRYEIYGRLGRKIEFIFPEKPDTEPDTSSSLDDDELVDLDIGIDDEVDETPKKGGENSSNYKQESSSIYLESSRSKPESHL